MVFGATQSEGVRGRSHLKRGASAVKPSTVVRHELAPRGGPDQFCVHSGCACPGREHASMPLNAFAMAGGWMINTTSPVRYGRVKSCPPSVVATSPSTMTLPGSLSGRWTAVVSWHMPMPREILPVWCPRKAVWKVLRRRNLRGHPSTGRRHKIVSSILKLSKSSSNGPLPHTSGE